MLEHDVEVEEDSDRLGPPIMLRDMSMTWRLAVRGEPCSIRREFNSGEAAVRVQSLATAPLLRRQKLAKPMVKSTGVCRQLPSRGLHPAPCVTRMTVTSS